MDCRKIRMAGVEQIQSVCTQVLEQGCFSPGEHQSPMELLWVRNGSIHSAADGRECRVRSGEVIIYRAGQYHVQYLQEDDSAELVSIQFTQIGFDREPLYNRNFPLQARAELLLAQILQENEEKEQYAQEMMCCLLTQLLFLLARDGKKLPAVVSRMHPENEIICRAQLYIGNHIFDRLSVPVVADHAEVSASYLTALFRKHLHISPGDYIRRAKLQQSKQMIRENQLNFTEIAEALQYSTVHHFSRQFKEKFGISPTEYAKSVRDS